MGTHYISYTRKYTLRKYFIDIFSNKIQCYNASDKVWRSKFIFKELCTGRFTSILESSTSRGYFITKICEIAEANEHNSNILLWDEQFYLIFFLIPTHTTETKRQLMENSILHLYRLQWAWKKFFLFLRIDVSSSINKIIRTYRCMLVKHQLNAP